jgi:hypothetical protein
MEMDLLMFVGPPKRGSTKILPYDRPRPHADTDILLLQATGKLSAGKLTAVTGIEDLGCGCLQGFCRAERQNGVSKVVEISHAKTKQLSESITATR